MVVAVVVGSMAVHAGGERVARLYQPSPKPSPPHPIRFPQAQQMLDTLPEQPLSLLHMEIHRTCCELALATLHGQAASLTQGQWSSRFKVHLAQTAEKLPAALQLTYTFYEVR